MLIKVLKAVFCSQHECPCHTSQGSLQHGGDLVQLREREVISEHCNPKGFVSQVFDEEVEQKKRKTEEI